MSTVSTMSSTSILGLLGSLGSAVGGGIAGLLVAAFAVAGILAYVLAIRYLVDIMEMKGYAMEKRWVFYLIGFFASPMVLGLIACAIPDNSK